MYGLRFSNFSSKPLQISYRLFILTWAQKTTDTPMLQGYPHNKIFQNFFSSNYIKQLEKTLL